jgi:hypothetical protein
MAESPVRKACNSRDPSGRAQRVVTFLAANKGRQPRDKIMHWSSFPSPRDMPICAYVEFANAVMRANEALQPFGWEILRFGEDYELAKVAA